ncbi:MAG: hypothetical protein M3304_08465, partial [Actinomycetota bacterium]|nr:hypothetical protein [Actinomycetota bacterium]
MPAKKTPSRVRPKTPARVRKTKTKRRARGRAHPELIGLGLVALGLFLTAVLLLGWDGGVVGEKVDEALAAVVGGARFLLPLCLLALGTLMVARSGLVDVRPFRTGLALCAIGLLTVLGEERGGEAGKLLETVLGRLLGSTGTFILGAFAFSAGVILLTGASVGAVLRRSANAARTAHSKASAARRTLQAPLEEESDSDEAPAAPPVDGEKAFPDVVADAERPAPAPALVGQLADDSAEPPDEPAASGAPSL